MSGSEKIREKLRSQALLMGILSHFIKGGISDSLREKEKKLKRLRPVFDYIDDHSDRLPGLPELAGLCHLEPSYFSRLFKEVIGLSPKAFMLRRQIEIAGDLLLSTNRNVQQISDDLGFYDPYHFSNTFKKIMGLSPREFRKQSIHRP